MTAWQAMNLDSVPKEVFSFIENMKCPICKGSVASTPPTCSFLGHNGEYSGFTSCATNPEEYWITLFWRDPKYISLEDETVVFWDEEREYSITNMYPANPGRVGTHVKISKLDESGSPTENITAFDLNGSPFDFERFDIDFYINLIKTYSIFR